MGACATKSPNENIYQPISTNDNNLHMFGNLRDEEENHQMITQIKDINMGEGYTIITDINDKHWVNGVNTRGQLGIAKCYTNVTGWQKSEYFHKNSIQISRICTSSNSFSTFWITDHKKVYASGAYSSPNGNQHIDALHEVTHVKGGWYHHVDALHEVIDVQGGWYHNVALCGATSYIISVWLRYGATKDIPLDLIGIIRNYLGSTATKVYCQTQIYSQWSQKFILYPWKLVNEFKDVSIESISCGAYFSLFLDSNGNVYSYGKNSAGQCGLGYGESKYDSPMLIPYFGHTFNPRVIIERICCGRDHSLCLSECGHVYAFGDNSAGQCGVKAADTLEPKLILEFSRVTIIDIKAAGNNSYAKSVNNLNFVWGDNIYGQATLSKKDAKFQRKPFMIDKVFQKKVRKKIKEVYLAVDKTYIICKED
eukprot:194426_1